MIQARYGWSDEVIGNLDFARFIQIKDRIAEREAQELKFKLRLEETKLKLLCQFIAANSPDGKTAKRNISAAESITLFREKGEEMVKNDLEEKRKRLKPGGFEQMMAFFGNFKGVDKK